MSTAVSTQALRKEFNLGWGRGRVLALEGLDLEVKRGEVFGLLGPNGSGKSTAMKMILGLLRPTSGRAEVCGARAGTLAARRQIGFLPENPYFPAFLSGWSWSATTESSAGWVGNSWRRGCRSYSPWFV